MFRASLHVYGGTFDSVTCHQRRYHYPRLRIVALSPAIGCMQRRCCSLCLDSLTSRSIGILAHPLPGSPQAERICLPYSVFRRIPWDFPLYTTKTKKRSKKTKIRKRSQKLRKRNCFRQDSLHAIEGSLTLRRIINVYTTAHLFITILPQAPGNAAFFRSRNTGTRTMLSNGSRRETLSQTALFRFWLLYI